MSPNAPTLDYPAGVAWEAVHLCREEALYASGLPHPDYGRRVKPVIDRISPDLKPLARSIAAEVVRAWEEAGRPHLTPERIAHTHQYALACMKAQTQENRP